MRQYYFLYTSTFFKQVRYAHVKILPVWLVAVTCFVSICVPFKQAMLKKDALIDNREV